MEETALGACKTVLVANPSAHSGRAKEVIRKASTFLNEAGIEHECVDTAPCGGTIGLVRRAVESGVERVIYMGGDGTFADVAKGILGASGSHSVAMGMLPTGTANDQGKSFGLEAGEAGLEDNVAVIAQGHTLSIDVGRVRCLDEAEQEVASDLFFDSMSFGFGAEVLAQRNVDREVVSEMPLIRSLYRDQLVYAGAMVKKLAASYFQNAVFDLEAVIDGKTYYFESIFDVIIKNTPVYGGEWILAPDARADDGIFELLPIEGRRDYTSKMLATLRQSPLKEEHLEALGIEHSRVVPGRQFSLTAIQPGAEHPPAAQIDGEEFAAGDRYEIDVLPRILRLIVPERFSKSA